AFGSGNVFLDIDNLMAGQRFDKELNKALAETDVFLSIIGPRWLDLLASRHRSGERDFVVEEIAMALGCPLKVIPVLIDQTPLPRGETLPPEIRDLTLHQKHMVSHERFGRDVDDLIKTIRLGRKSALWHPRALAVLGVSALTILVITGYFFSSKYFGSSSISSSLAGRPSLDQVNSGKFSLGQSFRDRTLGGGVCSYCPEMVVAPAGSFMMGSSDAEIRALAQEYPAGASWWKSEVPQHWVTFTRPFAVGKFEVTFEEWDACVADRGCKLNPSDRGWGRGRRPVISVSWEDAKVYLEWLSRKTGQIYGLLSEAEWEYVARAGTTTRYHVGDAISSTQAHFPGPTPKQLGGNPQTNEVGRFPDNGWGLHDVHGNVWEWTEDCASSDYNAAPADGSAQIVAGCERRVIRGGSWADGFAELRSASRNREFASKQAFSAGFRVMSNLDSKQDGN
ncbi:MAG: formylglycine-generating enzyme family protein, partial [Hyphomicrobium sp.]